MAHDYVDLESSIKLATTPLFFDHMDYLNFEIDSCFGEQEWPKKLNPVIWNTYEEILFEENKLESKHKEKMDKRVGEFTIYSQATRNAHIQYMIMCKDKIKKELNPWSMNIKYYNEYIEIYILMLLREMLHYVSYKNVPKYKRIYSFLCAAIYASGLEYSVIYGINPKSSYCPKVFDEKKIINEVNKMFHILLSSYHIKKAESEYYFNGPQSPFLYKYNADNKFLTRIYSKLLSSAKLGESKYKKLIKEFSRSL